MDETAVRKYLEVIRKACNLIESELSGKPAVSEPVVVAQAAPAQPADEEKRLHKEARAKHAQELLNIDCWPPAVPNHLMRTPKEQDQINRATAVLDMTLTCSLDGMSFLDYGCGEGYITASMLKRGVVSTTGYDIAESPTWKKHPNNCIFTTDKKALTRGGYDCVFLYDVLDHVHDPVEVMAHIKTLVKPTGVVYVRCHPWCAKHASHLFKAGLNKAYFHLFLSWEELSALGYDQMFTRPEIDPIRAYHYWFHQFKIVKETFHKSAISDFFMVPTFKQLVLDQQAVPQERREGFIRDMEIEFVDFILTP